jgi:hypothetical protein
LRSPLFQGLQLQPGETRLRPEDFGDDAWPEPGPAAVPAAPPDSYAPKLEVYGPGRAQAVSAVLPLEVDGEAEWARSLSYDQYSSREFWSEE